MPVWRKIHYVTAVCAALVAAVEPTVARASEACSADAMIVFDGSASMAESGNMGNLPTRIAQARAAVARAMPMIAPFRRVGLMVYGPTPGALRGNACNGIDLRLAPQSDAGEQILQEIDGVVPFGQTALTDAVAQAAEVLDYENEPALIVLITDGNETCGGSPCQLAAELSAAAFDLTVHVIGFRVRTSLFTHNDKAGHGATVAECLPALNAGRYVHTESVEDLADALERSLRCQSLSDLRAPQPESVKILASSSFARLAFDH